MKIHLLIMLAVAVVIIVMVPDSAWCHGGQRRTPGDWVPPNTPPGEGEIVPTPPGAPISPGMAGPGRANSGVGLPGSRNAGGAGGRPVVPQTGCLKKA
ncbi:MAG: hypothetical protein ABIK28_04680, partial [Planctomycetota bacterium]